ncbi:MAG: hypothetical protein K9N55_09920 [Phycisphaerae bacterium]|nr:hypothetical protein [Phycisphaerae bacterium]
MRRKTAKFQLCLWMSLMVAAIDVLPTTVRAATRTAAALTPEAVWDAINAAQDGDIVQLPKGTAVWKRGWNAGHLSASATKRAVKLSEKRAAYHR